MPLRVMWRRLLRFDGTFSTGARVAVVALVAAGFAFGYVAHPVPPSGPAAAPPIAKGRIEADHVLPRAEPRAALTSVAALPALARPAHRRRPERSRRATPEPAAAAAPVVAPVVTLAPAATAAPPVPPTPTPPAPRPTPTPAPQTFDSSG